MGTNRPNFSPTLGVAVLLASCMPGSAPPPLSSSISIEVVTPDATVYALEVDAISGVDAPAEPTPGAILGPCERKFALKTYQPPVFVTVPAGSFWFGCPPPFSCSYPATWIHLDAFAITTTEISVADIFACHALHPGLAVCSLEYTGRFGWLANNLEQDNCQLPLRMEPAKAEEFCKEMFGGATLPTEAQWEKAAKVPGTNSLYPWGDATPTDQLALFTSGPDEFHGAGTHCDPAFRPNGGGVRCRPAGSSYYGLLNMAGNVAESVLDGPCVIFPELPKANHYCPWNGLSPRISKGGGSGDSAKDGMMTWKGTTFGVKSFSNPGFRCVINAPK